ncbi:unnamed protein product [Lactuca saligna]|uniref:PB1-like domain-containing protein n=1 Tax=Lactuca saligna TaxID=75948 RepID=A0AA35YRM6_LACSI|nr:unnamed protein product [Lactuca saligna]
MAGPSNAKGSTYIQVDVHYDGMFSPIPHLIYYLNQKTSITDVDFGGLNFKEFIHVLEDVTKGKCPVVYYCLGHKSMRDGLTPLKNDDDYRRFLDVAHGNEGKINVYIDHYNDSVLDWIEEEKEEKNVDSESSDEDKDSVMSDALSVDHEPDEEIMEPKKPQFTLFMTQLRNGIQCNPSLDINMGNGAGLTLLSDQHKGLIEAVKERVPDAEHRQCARHKENSGQEETSKVLVWPSTKAKKKKGKHVPDVEDESEFEIEEMDEVENEYESKSESEIEELAEDGDEPDQGQVDEQVEAAVEAVEAVVEPDEQVEAVVEPDQEQVHEPDQDQVHGPVVEEPAAQPVVEVEQRAQPLKRKRKYSERITKVALRRVVNTKDGCGLSVNKPVTLE